MAALDAPGLLLNDLGQVVMRGQLVLSALVSATTAAELAPLVHRVQALGAELGMTVESRVGQGDNPHRRAGRYTVTLLAAELTPGDVSQLSGVVSAHGATIDRIRRLSRTPVTAFELEVSGADGSGLRAALAVEASRLRVDVAVCEAGLARRGSRLVVMDVDSTLIQDEVIELLARHAGREAEVAAVTEAAMRGELDFAASLRQRVATLEGLPAAVLHDVRAAVRLTPGAERLCRTLLRLGWSIGLVSGGFAEVVEPLAARLGVRYVRANRLELADDRLTGRVAGPIVDRAGKEAALREFAAAEGLPLSRTVAIGDGANDLDMLGAAGLGIAFNAKPLVRAQAEAALSVPNLDAVLYLLGLSSDEVDEADRAL